VSDGPVSEVPVGGVVATGVVVAGGAGAGGSVAGGTSGSTAVVVSWGARSSVCDVARVVAGIAAVPAATVRIAGQMNR
jgi:hypothetical protein